MPNLSSIPLATVTTLWLAAGSWGQDISAGSPVASGSTLKAAKAQPDLLQMQPLARQTLFDLRDHLSLLARKMRAPDARRIADSAIGDVDFMIRGWTPEGQIPAEYVASLRLSLLSLGKAVRSPEEGPAFSVLQGVADDLHIKADHSRRSGIGLEGMVTVVVRTRSGEREQRNLQVLYLPKLIAVEKDTHPDSFPKFSSPTSHSLQPGRYIMWTREPSSNMTSRRTIVKVGEGNSTVEWDLPSP